MSQTIDGLRGALIIENPNEINKYDDERIIHLADWYHSQTDDMLKAFMAPGVDGVEPIPDSGLINGKGRYNCDYIGSIPANANLPCTKNSPRSYPSIAE